MSGLKIGDIVMVGGAANPDFKARNAGKFRTVVGFKPEGYEFFENGYKWYCPSVAACLDQPVAGLHGTTGHVAELSIVRCSSLVKINPGDGEDEILTKVGKPESIVKSEQTKHLARKGLNLARSD